MLETAVVEVVERTAWNYFSHLPNKQKGNVLIIVGVVVGLATIGVGLYLRNK
jgi:hypothetical protein